MNTTYLAIRTAIIILLAGVTQIPWHVSAQSQQVAHYVSREVLNGQARKIAHTCIPEIYLGIAFRGSSGEPLARQEKRITDWLAPYGIRRSIGGYAGLMAVTAPIPGIEAMLHVTINDYVVSINGQQRLFYSLDREPTIEPAMRDLIIGIVGLENMNNGHQIWQPTILPGRLSFHPSNRQVVAQARLGSTVHFVFRFQVPRQAPRGVARVHIIVDGTCNWRHVVIDYKPMPSLQPGRRYTITMPIHLTPDWTGPSQVAVHIDLWNRKNQAPAVTDFCIKGCQFQDARVLLVRQH